MANDVNVIRVAVHQIDKKRNTQVSETVLSEELLPDDIETNNLVDKLNKSYQSQKIIYANFGEEDALRFPQELRSYLDDDTDEQFLESTSNMTNDLNNVIRTIYQASGGYFVYAQYQFQGREYFAVFLLRIVDSYLFERVGDSFMIDPTQHLEIDKLAMAGRVHIAKYLRDDGRYITFIYKKQSDISEYFVNWIGAEQRESNTTFTNDLYELLKQIELPTDDEGNEIDRDDYLESVYNYAYDKPDKTIDLHELGTLFYDDADFITNYALQNEFNIDTNFKFDNSAIKKFIRIDINKEGIKLRFPKVKLDNGSIRTDGSLTIIDSENIANTIRQESDN